MSPTCPSAYSTLLSETNNARVSCTPCGHYIRLEFGNIVLFHSRDSLTRFYDTVLDRLNHTRDVSSRVVRDLYFRTGNASLLLCFSPLEVQELHFALESAIIELYT